MIKIKDLKRLQAETDNELTKYVLTYLLEQGGKEEINTHIDDILNHGVNNGSVDFLVYYADTHKFYDKFYYEIEELRNEYKDNCGLPLEISGDLKDFMAKYAFYEKVYQIADCLTINN